MLTDVMGICVILPREKNIITYKLYQQYATVRNQNIKMSIPGMRVDRLRWSSSQRLSSSLPGIEWSDGTPLTADDSVYGYQLLANPDVYTWSFIVVRTAIYEALDELTTQWKGIPGFRDLTYYTNFFFQVPNTSGGSTHPKN